MSHLDIDITQTSWMDAASCASVDPLLFDQGDRAHANRYTDARRVCRACPVAAQCLTHAIERDERYGMWGGLTPEEREEIRIGRSRRRMSALEARDDVNRRNALYLLKTHREHIANGRSMADIAAAMGLKLSTYDRRMHRARATLRRFDVDIPA